MVPNQDESRIVRLRLSSVIIILIIQFACLGLLGWATLDLRGLHQFDQRRSYDVCVGANRQIERTILALTAPTPISPTASPEERLSAELRNKRTAESRDNIIDTIKQNDQECDELLNSPTKGARRMFEFSLDLQLWAFLGGTFVPILVGLLTKSNAPSGLKGFLNLVLSAVAGLIATAVATDGVLSQEAVVAGFYAFVASVGMYYGFLKPAGVTQAIQSQTPNFGLGPKTTRSSVTGAAAVTRR